MQARYYDPEIGRFMGIDPVEFKETNPIMFNRYAYANNNPYKFTDPNGEEAGSEDGNSAYNDALASQTFGMEGISDQDRSMIASGNVHQSSTEAKNFMRGVPDSQYAKEMGQLGGVAIALAAIATRGKVAPKQQSLFHYTDAKGLKGILDSKNLRPSLKANNPKDARYGDGQYLSNIAPGTKTSSQLSRQFIGQPFQGNKFSHYVEINTTGLKVVKGRDGVFVTPNNSSLNLNGRIISSGKN